MYRWYYVIPGPFRIKIPLEYIGEHLDDKRYEFEETARIERKVAEYILGDYYSSDQDLQALINEKYPQGIEAIREDVLSAKERENPCHRLWEQYRAIYNYLDDWAVVKTNEDMTEITGFIVQIYNYLDDWAVVKTNEDMTEITGFIVHRKHGEDRVETFEWK